MVRRFFFLLRSGRLDANAYAVTEGDTDFCREAKVDAISLLIYRINFEPPLSWCCKLQVVRTHCLEDLPAFVRRTRTRVKIRLLGHSQDSLQLGLSDVKREYVMYEESVHSIRDHLLLRRFYLCHYRIAMLMFGSLFEHRGRTVITRTSTHSAIHCLPFLFVYWFESTHPLYWLLLSVSDVEICATHWIFCVR